MLVFNNIDRTEAVSLCYQVAWGFCVGLDAERITRSPAGSLFETENVPVIVDVYAISKTLIFCNVEAEDLNDLPFRSRSSNTMFQAPPRFPVANDRSRLTFLPLDIIVFCIGVDDPECFRGEVRTTNKCRVAKIFFNLL